MAAQGLQYGPQFRGLIRVALASREAVAEIHCNGTGSGPYQVAPQLLDSGLQLLALLAAAGPSPEALARLPALVRSVRVMRRPSDRVACYAALEEGGGGDSLVGRVRLYDVGGAPVVDVEGLVLRPPGDALSARGWARERLYAVRWEERAAPRPASSAPAPGSRWLWVTSDEASATAVAGALKGQGRDDLVVAWPPGGVPRISGWDLDGTVAEARWAALLDRAGVDRAVWLTASLRPGDVALECERVLDLCRGVVRSRSAKLLWTTFSAHGAVPDPSQAALWGLARVFSREHPDRWGGLLDLPASWRGAADRAVATALAAPDAETLAGEAGLREPRLRRCPLPAPSGRPPIRSGATYVLTGGLGGVGLKLARWLVDRGAEHLLLVGRSAPSGQAAEAVRALQGRAKVQVVQADVAVAEDLARALAAPAGAGWPEVKGVFHLAGTLADAVIQNLDGVRLHAALAAKVSGGWNLHQATRSMALDHFVLFSSIAALGTPGQAAHAAANAFLDALAHRRRADGLPALSLGLGAVAEIGAAARLEARGRRGAPGVEPMDPDRVLEALGALLDTTEPHLLLASADWPTFAGGLAAGAGNLYSPLLERAASPAPASPGFSSWLRSQPQRARKDALEAHLREHVARILGLAPSQAPASDQPLMQAGLDSLMTVQLRNALRASLELDLPVTLLFDHPTILRLAEHLAGMLEERTPAAAPEVPVQGLEALLSDLEHMSEEEVERRLRDEPAGGPGAGS